MSPAPLARMDAVCTSGQKKHGIHVEAAPAFFSEWNHSLSAHFGFYVLVSPAHTSTLRALYRITKWAPERKAVSGCAGAGPRRAPPASRDRASSAARFRGITAQSLLSSRTHLQGDRGLRTARRQVGNGRASIGCSLTERAPAH